LKNSNGLDLWNGAPRCAELQVRLLQFGEPATANLAALSMRLATRQKDLMFRTQLTVASRKKFLKAAFRNKGWRRS
jgi:hypothetical protein